MQESQRTTRQLTIPPIRLPRKNCSTPLKISWRRHSFARASASRRPFRQSSTRQREKWGERRNGSSARRRRSETTCRFTRNKFPAAAFPREEFNSRPIDASRRQPLRPPRRASPPEKPISMKHSNAQPERAAQRVAYQGTAELI